MIDEADDSGRSFYGGASGRFIGRGHEILLRPGFVICPGRQRDLRPGRIKLLLRSRPDLEDPLLEQAEVIKREFPFIRVRTKHSPEILIEMFMRLTSRQQQSLYRVSERYLDFEVKCPDDVY